MILKQNYSKNIHSNLQAFTLQISLWSCSFIISGFTPARSDPIKVSFGLSLFSWKCLLFAGSTAKGCATHNGPHSRNWMPIGLPGQLRPTDLLVLMHKALSVLELLRCLQRFQKHWVHSEMREREWEKQKEWSKTISWASELCWIRFLVESIHTI